ncbi:MAG: UDP-N-acetylmuramoyl-L-alanyl-D-glutamate--2,6-diaminopimelate ligase [Ruminococcus bromii]|nr:UDP-N-acetylmuramoyl-L-alanyl-D-glutamate--2,6-diaminopimelate ligase [Ruminococcus bromii]
MKLKQLLTAIPYRAENVPDLDICDLVYDSRLAVPGCAFVCLRGANSDGHKYAAMAVEKGAVAVIAEEPVDVDVPVILTENTRLALAYLSAEFFGHPANDLRVIGITGTKGKTTTAFMMRAILEAAGHKTGVIGTIGVLYGDTLIQTDNTTPENDQVQKFLRQMADAGCEYCVMEVSSIGLKDHRVAGFTFDLGLFTNFSEDHIGGAEHKDMAEYMACKSLLFRMCRTGIINIDDPNWQGIVREHTCALVTNGYDEAADMVAHGDELITTPGFLGVRFSVSGKLNFTADVAIPGKFNVYNALCAITACSVLDIPVEAMQAGLRAVKVKGRVEPVEMPGDFTLLIDYAHNAVSMESILTTLRAYNPKRLVCMFGAGGNRPKVRRYEMGEVSGRLADLSVITADNSRYENVLDIIEDIKVGMHKTDGKYIEIPDRREAIRWCIENAQPGDIIVLAGKGHEDYQEIEGKKYPFDERVVIREILDSLKK